MSIDALLEDLWGDDHPQTAVKMIHVAVSQLRKVLPAGVLQTRAPGYAVQATTDLQRFEALRSDGRVRDALALWRGPALAEFEAPLPAARARVWRSCASRASRIASTRTSRAASTARSSPSSSASSPPTRCASSPGAS